MWYAMQVQTGKERRVCQLCRQTVDTQALQECFIPAFERMKKMKGLWTVVRQPLFPGYVFVVCDDAIQLHHQLKRVPELTKILGDGVRFIPLRSEEIRFIEEYGGHDRSIRLSRGYEEGDSVQVIEGPLQGHEGQIVKIDRHKRLAVVNLRFFGKSELVKMGLEIIKKS